MEKKWYAVLDTFTDQFVPFNIDIIKKPEPENQVIATTDLKEAVEVVSRISYLKVVEVKVNIAE